MRFNKQGRTVSDSMRIKELALHAAILKKPVTAIEYRGCFITGTGSKRWVGGSVAFPCPFPSIAVAKMAIDRCLALRAEAVE